MDWSRWHDLAKHGQACCTDHYGVSSHVFHGPFGADRSPHRHTDQAINNPDVYDPWVLIPWTGPRCVWPSGASPVLKCLEMFTGKGFWKDKVLKRVKLVDLDKTYNVFYMFFDSKGPKSIFEKCRHELRSSINWRTHPRQSVGSVFEMFGNVHSLTMGWAPRLKEMPSFWG